MAGRGNVRVSITSDTAGLQRGTKQAETSLGRLGSAAQTTGHHFSALAKAAGLAALAYGAVTQAKKAITTTETLAKATENLHRNFGLSFKAASEWGAVLQANGIDASSAHMAFTTLSKSLVNLQKGSKPATAAFKDLGLSQKDLQGLNFQQSLDLVTKGLTDMKGGTERAADAQVLLGRGAKLLAPLFRGDGLGFQQQAKWAEKYGATLDGHAIKSSKDLKMASEQLKFAQMGLQIQFTEKVAPALLKVEKAGGKVLAIFRDPNLTSDQKWKKISDILGGMATKLEAAFEKAFPRIIDFIAGQAPRAASAFVKAWLSAGIWGKLFTVALIGQKLGVFSSVGKMAVRAFALRFIPGMAETGVAGGEAAAGAEGLASAGILAKFKGAGRLLGLAAGGVFAASFIAKLAGIKDADPLAFLNPQNAGDPRPGHGDVQPRSNKLSYIDAHGHVHFYSGATQPPTHHPHGHPRAHGGSVAHGATVFASTATRAKAATGTLSLGQLQSLWIQAGGPRDYAVLMSHVAMAESGGNPNAKNASGASGLWQILGQPFAGDVFDPLTNAKMAVWKLKNQGLGAWAASEGSWGQYRDTIGQKPSGGGSGAVSLGSSTSASPPPITPKFPTRLRSAIKGAQHTFTGLEGQSSDIDRLVSQYERRGDYGGAADLLGTKLSDEKRMRSAAKAALRGYQKELKILRHQMRTAPKGRRSQIAAAIKDVLGKIADLKGTIHDLGFDIGDIQLDIQDEGTQAESKAMGAYQQAASDIDLQVAAGVLTPAQGAAAKQTLAAQALGGGFGALSQRDIWQVMADQLQATQDNTAATTAQTEALNGVAAEMKRNNDINEGTLAITGREATRAMTDVLAGQLGYRVSQAGFSPGFGVGARY
jgi:hypothetical protein